MTKLYADEKLFKYLEEWVLENTDYPISFTNDDFNDLLEYATIYKRANEGKIIAYTINNTSPKKTQQELIDRNIPKAEKMINDLMGHSRKGYKLQEILIDMIENPKDYFAKQHNPKPNSDDIRRYLNKWKFDAEPINRLIQYLRNPS